MEQRDGASRGSALDRLERPGAEPFASQPHFRLGEQLQQIGPRRIEADLDHPVGHRDDFGNRAKRILQAVAASGPQGAGEHPGHVARLDRPPIGPVARAQPEDIAKPVVADVPPFGQPGLDLPARIEADQPLRDVADQHLLRGGQRPGARIDDGRCLVADHQHVERVGVAITAPGKRQCQQDRNHGKTRHAVGLTLWTGSSSIWISAARLFYMTKAVAVAAVLKGSDGRGRYDVAARRPECRGPARSVRGAGL